ncbi:hypothetical protein I5G97_gp068 [Mycobacterium phage Curiosium]|uniref:DUF732 domain-containing protein n=1 Tax=Mycobacterium phage Curiosium TaxID=2599859 RepID=A0A5J6TVZ5_9CAUD|nr:hypothetical protein I5G97_gp068 [Mycobacterium phage Curiosium]QFG14087.1 hypothetical protein PBI_CURIOSIUM_42 [Mycobacterium phage Curiosium]
MTLRHAAAPAIIAGALTLAAAPVARADEASYLAAIDSADDPETALTIGRGACKSLREGSTIDQIVLALYAPMKDEEGVTAHRVAEVVVKAQYELCPETITDDE